MAFLATSAYQHKGKRWTSEDPNEASTTANRNSQPSSVRSGVSSTKPRSSTASGDSHRSVAAEPPQQTTKRRSPPGSSTQFTSDLQDPAPIGVNIPPSSNQGGRGHRSSTYPPVDSSKLGPSARNALIVATVVGGVLLLALLACLFRRSRRRSRPEATTLMYHRPPSTVTFYSVGTRDANLTALPMYRDRKRNMDNIVKKSSEPRIRELSAYNPPNVDSWKTANPPTPLTSQFPSKQDDSIRAQHLRAPDMALAACETPTIRLSSHGNSYFTVAESIYPPSEVDLEAAARLQTPQSDTALRDRWSWTTSYASARSRLDSSSLGSTIGSLPGVRTVKGWIGFQSEAQRRLGSSREGDAGPSRSASFGSAFFKNKATKPNLAPTPVSDYYLRDETRISGAREGNTGGLRAMDDIDAIVPDDGVFS